MINPHAVATGGEDQRQRTLSRSFVMVLRFESLEVERTRKMSCVWARLVYYIKNHIRELYEIPGAPTAIARRVEHLLENDRFMCPSNG